MVRSYVFSLITMVLLLGSQADAMNQQIAPAKSRRKPKFTKYHATVPELEKKFTSNRIESILLTAVHTANLEGVKAFFNKKEMTSNLRSDGCIIAFCIAEYMDESTDIDMEPIIEFLLAQAIVRTLLIQETPIGLNILFPLCCTHGYNITVCEIINDPETFEAIFPELLGDALLSIIEHCSSECVELFLANTFAQNHLTVQDLEAVLILVENAPFLSTTLSRQYHSAIQKLIEEKR